jgi:hypothetical protein
MKYQCFFGLTILLLCSHVMASCPTPSALINPCDSAPAVVIPSDQCPCTAPIHTYNIPPGTDTIYNWLMTHPISDGDKIILQSNAVYNETHQIAINKAVCILPDNVSADTAVQDNLKKRSPTL